EAVVARSAHGRLERHVPAEDVRETGAPVHAEQTVLRATAQVAVHEQRATSGIREGDSEVRSDERLPVPGTRTADRHHDRTGGPVGVGESQTHAAHRFGELHALLARELMAGARLEVWHGAEDRQPEVL